MTAGSGIIHQEMPQAADHMLGAQLWLNLPRADKMTEPTYREITAADLAIYEDDQVHVKL
jgi:quercetin 2,3-dioxygenase